VKECMRILLVFLISLTFMSCLNRAPSIRSLDKRAQYRDAAHDARTLRLGAFGVSQDTSIPMKSQAKVRKVRIHRFEMKPGAYFLGGFLVLEIERGEWLFQSLEWENPASLYKEERRKHFKKTKRRSLKRKRK